MNIKVAAFTVSEKSSNICRSRVKRTIMFFLSHLSTLLLFLWLYKLSGTAVLKYTHPQFYPVNLSIRVGINVDPD